MRRIDVEKKRKTAWPWVIGLGVLALALWGATSLLLPDPEPEEPDIGVTAADTLPPALIPSLPGGGSAPAGTSRTGADPELGEDQLDEVVRVNGEVLATASDAFWILTASQVLRVDSPRRARKGDTVTVEGTLRRADTEKTDRIASEFISRHPAFDSWTVLRSLKLVEEGAPDSPGGPTDGTGSP